MTPTDIMPARLPTTADATSVRAVGAKSGNASGEGDAGFRDLLKQIAGDKGEQKGTETANAHGKDNAVQGRTRTLDQAKALAELRARQGKDPRVQGTDLKDAEAEAATKGDDAETDAGSEAGTLAKEAKDGASVNAVAMLLSLAHKGETPAHNLPAQGKSGGAPSPDATLGTDAEAVTVANKALREVKVVSVKVETHFAAVRTDAATTGFAQRLAMTQISTNAQPGSAEGAKGKSEAKQTLDATAVTGTEKAGDVRTTRGQAFAARPEHRGADNSGTGAGKSAADSKSAASASPTATQRSNTPASDATQAGPVQTPMQQLSNRLLATAHELQQAASAAPASGVGADASNASAPVRVLSINLHPEELGSVTVRMSMVAGSLDVQIDAEMPDTAQLLRTDTDQITDMLRSAGIQLDGITVRAASPDFVSTSGGSTGTFFDQSQSQSQSGGAQSDARGTGGQRRGDDPSQSFGRSGAFGQDDESRPQRGRGTGLYV